jgi:hypothetical protein
VNIAPPMWTVAQPRRLKSLDVDPRNWALLANMVVYYSGHLLVYRRWCQECLDEDALV